MKARSRNLTIHLALALTLALSAMWILGTHGAVARFDREAQAAQPPVQQATVKAPAPAGGPAQSIQYTYDAAGRLTGVNYGDRQIAYTYDSAGNLLSRRVTEGNHTYLPVTLKE